MPCYKPLRAYRLSSGEIVFAERGDVTRTLDLACGQCIGCRLERSRQWAVRCMHEASASEVNCFITLTYDDDHVPRDLSLDYSHFQLFLKRLRARLRVRIRFYMCGEYGDDTRRPHFHACLFGVDFLDKVPFSKSEDGSQLFSSKLLDDVWGKGFCTVGALTFESAAYVARYVMKKISGPQASPWFPGQRLDFSTGEIIGSRKPEFNHMSLKPGIGRFWIERFLSDVYPSGRCVVAGRETLPPRYYDKFFKSVDLDAYEQLLFAREMEGHARSADGTNERLAVRELVAQARVASLKRSLP